MTAGRSFHWFWVLGGYLLLAGLFFYPFFQGKVIFYIDNLLHIAPAYAFWKAEILAGRLPLWNPYIFAGMPFLADPSHPVFSPLNLFYLVIPNIFQAITLQAMFLVALAGSGGFYLGGKIGLEPRLSWFVGLLYGFSGVMLGNTGDINSLVGLTLLPWLIGLFHQEVRLKRFFSWRLSAGVALTLMSAHPQYLFFAGLGMGASLMDYLIRKKGKMPFARFAKGIFETLGLGMGLAACQLGPTLELVQLTNRSETIAQLSEQANLSEMKPVSLVTALFPRIFGSLAGGSSWGPGSLPEHGLASVNLFASASGLVLAAVGLVVASHYRRSAWWLVTGVLGVMLLALGETSPVFQFFYAYVPGFSLFRSPDRILVLYSLGLALMAGLGLKTLMANRKKSLLRLRWITIAIAIIGLGVLWGLWSFQSDIFVQTFAQAYQWLKHKPLPQASVYSLPKVAAISRLLLESGLLFLVGVLSFASLASWVVTQKLRWWVVAVGLVITELFWGVRGGLLFTQPSALTVDPQVVQALGHRIGAQRYVTVSEIQPYSGIWIYLQHLMVRPPFSQERITDQELEDWYWLRKEMQQLPTNTNMLYGLKSSSGYVALLPQAYRDFVQSSRVNQIDFQDFRNPALDEMATRYFLFSPQEAHQATASSNLAKMVVTPEVVIFENAKAQPRTEILVEGQPSLPAIIREDLPDRMVVETEAEQAGTLVVRDFWYPGWRAEIDGNQSITSKYQGLFRSVPLPAGKHRVVFTFRPTSVIISLSISLMMGLVLARIIILEYWKTWKRR